MPLLSLTSDPSTSPLVLSSPSLPLPSGHPLFSSTPSLPSPSTHDFLSFPPPFGVQVIPGKFYLMIPKGSAAPVQKSGIFTTTIDNQQA